MKRLLFLLLFPSICFAQQWTGVVDPSRAITWSPGAPNINETRTQCVTTACATVSGGSVTSTTVNAALASAPAHTYVLIPAGTFTLTNGIYFASISNVTLRGSGSNSTFLLITGANSGNGNCSGHDICAQSSDTNYEAGPANSANWTAGYTAGATSITLSSTTNLHVGNPLILDQIDTQADNGALYEGCEIADGSTECYSAAGPNSYERGAGSLTTIRGQQQVVTVTAISGSTVSISPGLYMGNWASGHSPGAWWAGSPVQNDAVESLSVDHTNNGATTSDGITFFNCQGCWVKGIRSLRQSTTGTAWGHVTFHICNKCTVRDSYFYGDNNDAYGVVPEIGSDDLIENNIFQFYNTTAVPNADCEGCVWSYNFQPGGFSTSANWLGVSEEFHGIDNFILSEGNIGAGVYLDSFHGNHDLDTFFRNRYDGREQSDGAATTSNTVAFRINPGSRYMNVIGNVLGTPGYHTSYEYPASGGSLYTSVIGCGAYPEVSMTNDSLSCSTSMFWGNWDSAHSAIEFNSSEVPSALSSLSNAVPSSHTLPASFLYSSAPSWWPSGKAWPTIGPDITGGNVGQCSGGTFDSSEVESSAKCTGGTMTPLATVTSNPAMDCYFNTMGGSANGTGSPVAFDSSTCFGASSPPPPTVPTGLNPRGVVMAVVRQP
jgi:hypothetical protein